MLLDLSYILLVQITDILLLFYIAERSASNGKSSPNWSDTICPCISALDGKGQSSGIRLFVSLPAIVVNSPLNHFVLATKHHYLKLKTYEMHMFHSASLKLGLDRAVLAHQRQNANPDESSSSKRKSKAEREEQAKEIDQLLKKGAYDVFNDEDDKEAQKFMDTDIDQLLEQSSRKVTYGDTATKSLSSGLGSFSKASFVADTGEGDGKDVDLDDPDFWSKAVGLEAPPEEMDEDLALIITDGSKRERKKVAAFDFGAEQEAEEERKRLEKIERMKQEELDEKERQKLEKWLSE